MKILYVHRYETGYELGGADRGVLELATGMKARGHDVMAVMNRGLVAEEIRKAGIPVREIPYAKWRTPEMLLTFSQLLGSFKPDVVHSHHRYTTFLWDVFLKSRGIPILHTQRVLSSDKKGFFRYGTFATSLSAELTEQMIRHYGIPHGRIRTIMNAVRYSPPDTALVQAVKQKYFPDFGKIYALCTGRLEEQKGQVYLIDAVNQLPEVLRDRLRIVFAGDGSLEAALKARVKKYGLENHFLFAGYAKDHFAWLACADFFILPSLWEGLPRSVIEAFHAGKPVIATDVSGTRETVQDKIDGRLVPPHDPAALAEAIRFFMENEAERKAMGERAKKSAEKFSFETMLLQYENLYKELSR